MIKHNMNSPGVERLRIPRCRTQTPASFRARRISLNNPTDRNDLIQKLNTKKKKYSILNVPKLSNFGGVEEENKVEEREGKNESVQEISEQNEQIQETKEKEEKVKIPLAKIKKIRRCYRPSFLHNQENLKAELEKIKEIGAARPRVAFNENCKNEAKSDIEQIIESQDYFRSFRGMKNVKHSVETQRTERALERPKNNIKDFQELITSNEFVNKTPPSCGKKSSRCESETGNKALSSCKYLNKSPVPNFQFRCEKKEKRNGEYSSRSYSKIMSHQVVKRVKKHKIESLL